MPSPLNAVHLVLKLALSVLFYSHIVLATTVPLHGKNLRVMPLGDSITDGWPSKDEGGYRSYLALELVGNTVDMIGSLMKGDMPNNQNEGHSGAVISQIASWANFTLPQRPNVVLLMAGANDMNQPSEPDTAPERLFNLVDHIFATCPDATVFVAMITPNIKPEIQARIEIFNNAIPPMVKERLLAGKHLGLVNMSASIGLTDLSDGLHPLDEGYKKMSDVWYAGLENANALGWLHDPVTVPGHMVCNHTPSWIPKGEVFDGRALGKSRFTGIVCENNVADSSSCFCTDNGGASFVDVLSGKSCVDMSIPTVTAVRFADLTGDGRSDLLWVHHDGSVTAYLNQKQSVNDLTSSGIGFLPPSEVFKGVGARRGEVQFADLNGDGRAEYLWVHSNGSVEAWLNMGFVNDGPEAGRILWHPQGLIVNNMGENGAGVRFADLSGDGKAEYLWVDDNGSVTAWLNLGGPADGLNDGKVNWRAQGLIAGGVGGTRAEVGFADINGEGRAEYLRISLTDGSVKEWYNSGGTDSGLNAAKTAWIDLGTIADSLDSHGNSVQFADLDGDGRADYLVVDLDSSAVTVYLNGC